MPTELEIYDRFHHLCVEELASGFNAACKNPEEMKAFVNRISEAYNADDIQTAVARIISENLQLYSKLGDTAPLFKASTASTAEQFDFAASAPLTRHTLDMVYSVEQPEKLMDFLSEIYTKSKVSEQETNISDDIMNQY